jgi:hypothetical protein
MSRFWNEFVAGPIDILGFALVTLILIAVALLAGAAWQWWPAWIPTSNPFRGLFRRRSWRRGLWSKIGLGWRRKRKRHHSTPAETTVVSSTDELPDLPVTAFLANADRLAAEGRYAEAVRERLRAIVRTLVETGVIVGYPGWTVTELARAAAAARGALRQPLDDAGRVFSDIWYGERPAYAAHDESMRAYTRQITEILEPTSVGATR